MDKKADMLDEYDFSKGERGRFYIPADKIHLPLYLSQDIEERLRFQASKLGKTASELATEMLASELRRMESP